VVLQWARFGKHGKDCTPVLSLALVF